MKNKDKQKALNVINEKANDYANSQGYFRGACAAQISMGYNCIVGGYAKGYVDGTEQLRKQILSYIEKEMLTLKSQQDCDRDYDDLITDAEVFGRMDTLSAIRDLLTNE